MKDKRFIRGLMILILIGGILMLSLSGCFGKKYKVDYDGKKEWYKGAKDEYRAGSKVTLYYDMIATDTDYDFYLEGGELHRDYDDKKGFILTFIMPEHDVKLIEESRNTMLYIPPEGERIFEKEAVLTFDSFAGGGPEYTVTADDPSIVTWKETHDYGSAENEVIDGAGYTVIFTFTGVKPGKTTITVSGNSPIAEYDDEVYEVTVNDDLEIAIETPEG